MSNLLSAADASFETWSGDWVNAYGAGSVAQSSTNAHTGSNSLAVTSAAGSFNLCYAQAPITTGVTNGWCVVSGYALAPVSSPTASIHVEVDLQGGVRGYSHGLSYIGNSTALTAGVWTRFSFTFSAYPGNAYSWFYFIFAPSAGSFPATTVVGYLDDVYIGPGASYSKRGLS